ncbi:restriction endonuclease subunit R [Siphonobacter sp. BAB-5405]|uniref:type I restriction enzyme HsdR N-terminal domain-containing protein n=1 Tax=Siphonobacter sp. BAB-5405 TaxID=1864825 RepID=UPI000C80E30A|nr:type I restriction enzyme HsdR N-terminal domain-containing protein [Siphonobacter sp. BAB-5405]PMD98160.1 restriction endonuclease subunit R [Siphonobacter sp. BAB-5405]
MVNLNLPAYEYQLREWEGLTQIFCGLRKKWLVLTPEEWVRQHFVALLVGTYAYPKSLLKIEGGLSVYKTAKRSDLVMYDRDGLPFLLVECKAPEVKITTPVLEQALRYNHVIKAPYVALSNGMEHFVFQLDPAGKLSRLTDLPTFGKKDTD